MNSRVSVFTVKLVQPFLFVWRKRDMNRNKEHGVEEEELFHRCWATTLKKYFQILVEQMEAQKSITAETHHGYLCQRRKSTCLDQTVTKKKKRQKKGLQANHVRVNYVTDKLRRLD